MGDETSSWLICSYIESETEVKGYQFMTSSVDTQAQSLRKLSTSTFSFSLLIFIVSFYLGVHFGRSLGMDAASEISSSGRLLPER